MLDRVAKGELPAKHHVALRSATGDLRHEECITRDGFDGPYTIAYHLRRPHIAKPASAAQRFAVPSAGHPRPLLRRHYDSNKLPSGGTALESRTPLLHNRDVVLSISKPGASDAVYFSNGDGDDLFFVFEGAGTLRTIFGDVPFAKNDYVCVPRGTIHRFVFDPGSRPTLLGIECRGGIGLLEQSRNAVGQLRMDAPYCHRDFVRPVFSGPLDEGIRHLVVKRLDEFHGYDYDESPLDLVGWDGAVYPWVLPILKFQPRVGLVHLPPTSHGTFSARGALICSFVPRLLDFHPDAIPCPYPHSSVDVDEFIFYCDGNFTSRRGVGPGSISHHPAGIPHGPHAGAYEGSIGQKSTNELAVMLDCYEPLVPTDQALVVEEPGYHDSFR
ncbi:MAG: homogentisate 1,2-dioxygenase [Myxococcota bacterium]|nr:homogentisate 1,2-dioxygenase [Myxococcota bacterium]